MKERLQKILARAGFGSRRKVEELILSGRVSLNGEVVKELGIKADSQQDQINVDGERLKLAIKPVYLAFYKPVGYVTTRDDELGRPTVYKFLPKELKKLVWPVGRLDYHTSGLLIFTNDGGLTQKLTHPKFEHDKEYWVKINKSLTEVDADRLRQGIDIGERVTSPARLRVLSEFEVRLTIKEGAKRQVRLMFEALGYRVKELKRTRVAKLRLDELGLKPGEHRQISQDDIL